MNAANIIQIATVYSMHSRLKLSTIGVYAVNVGKIMKRLGAGGSTSSRIGLGWGNIFRRLNDSLIGDVIGAPSLFITLIGLPILGVGLS